MPWTEKYRPRTVDELIITEDKKKRIIEWIKNWHPALNSKKALILYGPAGVGKTTSCYAIANEFGLRVIEMNASDLRNAEQMKKIAGFASLYTDLFSDFTSREGPDKLILIDEADNIFESRRADMGGDYGGLTELLEIVRASSNPIILTMNDFYKFKRKAAGREIAGISEVIDLEPYKRKRSRDHQQFLREVFSRIFNILESEGRSLPKPVVEAIVERNGTDIRSIINDVESVAYLPVGERLRVYDTWKRDSLPDNYKLIEKTLWRPDYDSLLSIVNLADMSVDDYLAWIDENLSSFAVEPDDLANSYDYLSKADIFRGAAHKLNHYGFWPYAKEIAGGARTVVLNSRRQYVKLLYPTFIKSMGKTKRMRSARNSLLMKLGRLMHCGPGAVQDNLWFFSNLYRTDRKAFESLARRLNLSEDERNIILRRKV